jgi:TonB family C-terminal domain
VDIVSTHGVMQPMNSRCRFVFAVVLAMAAHAIFILGVSFTQGTKDPIPKPPLEIILVQAPTLETPDQAEYLGQAGQEGGSAATDKRRPQNPLSAIVPGSEQGGAPTIPAVPAKASPQKPNRQQALTREHSERSIVSRPQSPPAPAKEFPSAVLLLIRGMEIARLSAEINQFREAQAKRPRHKRISAHVREYKYASYMHAWVYKVERVGNLNYPDEARRRNVSGQLLLDVALKSDGTIDSISLLKSSGHKILDEAAVRIVQLASPFATFPAGIRAETDVLHIIRTWKFLTTHRLFSG